MSEIGIPPVLQSLSTLVDQKPQSYVRGNEDVRSAALAAAQYIFDLSVQAENLSLKPINALLQSLSPSDAPETRSQSLKRKRSPDPPINMNLLQSTPLAQLFTEGMDDEQIWAQLDLKAKHVGDILERALETENPDDLDEEEEGSEDALSRALAALGQGEDGELDFADDDFNDEMMDSEDDMDEDDEDDEEDEDEEEEESSDDEPHEEGVMELRDPPDISPGPSHKRQKPRSGPSSALDDGFFDLKAFNKATEAAEARAVSSGRLDGDDDSDDETIDLFAPVDDTEGFEEADLETGSTEPYYKDFFAPPRHDRAHKGAATKSKPAKVGGVRFHDEVRVKKIKAKGRSMPVSSMYDPEEDDDEDDGLPAFEDGWDEEEGVWEDEDESDDADELDEDGQSDEELPEDDESAQSVNETMDRFKDDLFADDDEAIQQDMTTHQKRIADIKEQISTLEDENVGKKDWTLMGEASSRTRPQNSLLEEDLEFERVMKAAPIITEEVVQGLEERIKARILEGNFDDVVRKRAVDDKPFLPSRVFELKDTKSTQSLAQIYEDEYMATQTNGPTDDRDGKLKKEHDEIDKLWENICSKLDALCNTHFTPKQPKATISSISNVSSTSLESALPTMQSNATMLAPEEVHKPSAADLKSRTEMTPAEKRALRGKVRKANKKSRDRMDTAVDKYAKAKGSIKKQKEAALESVVKSGKGVTVVGKQRKDILGKNKKGAKP